VRNVLCSDATRAHLADPLLPLLSTPNKKQIKMSERYMIICDIAAIK